MKAAIFLILAVVAIAGCVGQTPGQKTTEMLAREPAFEVSSFDVSYLDGATGFLARPAEAGRYPGVVLIHEWWGLNENIKEMARQLAGQGYIALAVDLYNGQVAATPEQARQLVSGIDQAEALDNMRTAVAYLRTQQNAEGVASLGWCFGGGQSMQLALSGEQLDATIIYYGSLVTNQTQLSSIEWPVLGVFGEADQAIPVASAREFDAALDRLGIENEVYIYPGVGHAFANPSGANYAPEETVDAWEKTLSFLERNLKD